jgi:hypothetical protein
MSEQQTAEAVEAEATENTTEQAPATPKPTETVEFWKQKAREQEKRAKENATAAQRLADLEDAQKTAEQKAADKLAELTAKEAALAAKEARADVSATTGIPAQILAGPEDSTPEAIQAFADLLTAHVEAAGKPRAPRPDANQGRSGGAPSSPVDSFANFFRNNLPER